jgi:hypothetical protein
MGKLYLNVKKIYPSKKKGTEWKLPEEKIPSSLKSPDTPQYPEEQSPNSSQEIQTQKQINNRIRKMQNRPKANSSCLEGNSPSEDRNTEQ